MVLDFLFKLTFLTNYMFDINNKQLTHLSDISPMTFYHDT